MVKNNLFILLFILFFSLLSCSGGSSSGSSDDLIPVYSETYHLTVDGTSAETCEVLGSEGRSLGSGSPDDVSYEVGLEEVAIVECGDLSAVFTVGDESATVSEETTAVAQTLSGASLTNGSVLLASVVQSLADEFADEEALVSVPALKLPHATTGSSVSSVVTDSLVQFINARDSLSQPLDAATRKRTLISLLINVGEAVIIESVGQTDSVIDACTDSAASIFSQYAKAVNASTVGLTGCLVYHSLDAVTDLNNPEGAPATNVPSSFRSIIKETGILKELIDSYTDNRLFTLGNVHTLLFTNIGHTAYSQDDEGVTTSETITTTDLSDFFSSLLQTPVTGIDQMKSYRFHTGYNPSGGWEVNVAAASQTLPAACVDSSRTTTCNVSPLRFDFNGTTLTQNASGSYLLRMTYSNGSFLNEADVINATTSKPYRDSLYQPVSVTISASDYSAIDYANPLYQEALDPMEDSQGNSAPYSNAAWRALYPNMANVDNAYLFPNAEVAAKLILLTNTNLNLDRLSALQAYALSRLATRGMAAMPVSDGDRHAILEDHGKTLSQWQDTVTTWLQTGSSVRRLNVSGGLNFKDGVITIDSNNCWTSTGVATCTVTSTLRFSQTGAAVANGTQYAIISGSLTVSNNTFGTVSYQPTYILVSPDNKSAQLLGSSDLMLTFPGTDLNNRFQGNARTRATYSITALTSS